MLIDSNILVYSLNSASLKNKSSQKFINENLKTAVIAHQNIFETLRVITHSKYPNPMPSGSAIKALLSITNTLSVISPDERTQPLAFELINKYNVNGNQIFDAYLIATALSNDIKTIATDNTKHFKIYEEINIANPFNQLN